MKPPLRAVKATERAQPKKKPLSVTQAVELGDHGEILVALRQRLAAAMLDPQAHPRDLAALSRQVVEITNELEAAKAGTEEDGVGEAAKTADEAWQSI